MIFWCFSAPRLWEKRDEMAWHLVSSCSVIPHSAERYFAAVAERVDAVPAGDNANGDSV